MATIAVDVATASADGRFAAAAFRDRLENGRKVAIQILEFFDRHGLTLRRGDWRRINPNMAGKFIKADAPQAAQPQTTTIGGDASPVGRPDFKSGKGRETVLGGFNSHSLPPESPPSQSQGIRR
jgi:selenocysteine-specific elongation factor